MKEKRFCRVMTYKLQNDMKILYENKCMCTCPMYAVLFCVSVFLSGLLFIYLFILFISVFGQRTYSSSTRTLPYDNHYGCAGGSMERHHSLPRLWQLCLVASVM